MLGLGNSSIKARKKVFNNMQSLYFDNTDDIVDLSNSDYKSVLDSSDFEVTGSISVWANFNATGDNGIIIDHSVDTNNRIFIMYKHANDTISCSYRAGGTTRVCTLDLDGDDDDATTSIEGQGWFHIAFTWDKTGTSKAYLNAANTISVSTQDISGLTWTGAWTGAKIHMGESFSNGSDFWGYADEFAIFNDELTPDEITNIYNNGIPKDEIGHDGLMAYWRLEERTGTTIYDEVESYEGSISGAVFSGRTP